MSGLDNSQPITDEASLHAETAHVHSHPEALARPGEKSDAESNQQDDGDDLQSST